jgi:hypothetical protein
MCMVYGDVWLREEQALKHQLLAAFRWRLIEINVYCIDIDERNHLRGFLKMDLG